MNSQGRGPWPRGLRHCVEKDAEGQPARQSWPLPRVQDTAVPSLSAGLVVRALSGGNLDLTQLGLGSPRFTGCSPVAWPLGKGPFRRAMRFCPSTASPSKGPPTTTRWPSSAKLGTPGRP